nr:hypothetical protein CFP56_23412 [Quercus suber]
MLCLSLRNAVFGSVLLMPDRVFTADHQLVMAPKRAMRGKSKAASKPEVVFDQLRSKYKRHGLFFPVLIHRVLKYLELQNFPSQELVHIQAQIGAKFLKQRSAQKKFGDPSVGSSKRPRVQSNTGDVPYEDMHGDPTAAVVEDGDDEVDVDTTAAAQIGPPPPSLHDMMETVMMT